MISEHGDKITSNHHIIHELAGPQLRNNYLKREIT